MLPAAAAAGATRAVEHVARARLAVAAGFCCTAEAAAAAGKRQQRRQRRHRQGGVRGAAGVARGRGAQRVVARVCGCLAGRRETGGDARG